LKKLTPSPGPHAFTPEALRVCRSRHPEIQLAASENNAAEITEAVSAGRLHCTAPASPTCLYAISPRRCLSRMGIISLTLGEEKR
jgi:hypothetical protein